MHLTTVAEGIEDDGQANWLASANCAIGQGFLWSKPVPISDATALLTRSSWAAHAGHAALHTVDPAAVSGGVAGTAAHRGRGRPRQLAQPPTAA